MRVTAGAVAVLGLAVAVAEAQPTKERAAALKAPQALSADELPPVARGAVGDFPTTISGTPVTRPGAAGTVPPGPAWLTGDTGVAPAGGIATKSGAVRPLGTPPTLGKDEKVPPPPKMLDRLKIFPDKAPAQPEPQPVVQAPPQPAPAPQPSASTPFRGTGTNGAPVFAGPPAYRWYGWGSVTPGANPLAPAGQYPKASANWYQITGATPGAFPVPVTAGARAPAGTEPPTYGLAPRTPAPAPVVTVSTPPTAPPTFVERPEPSKFPTPERAVPAPTLGALPPPTFGPPAVPVPSLTPPPIPTKSAVLTPTLPLPPTMPPAPVTVMPPALPKPELPPAPIKSVAAPAPVAAPKAEPVAALPPPDMPLPPLVPSVRPDAVIPSVAPAMPVSVMPTEPAKAVAPAAPPAAKPAALPTSVTADPPRDDAKWKQSTEAPVRPGTWAPAVAPTPSPLPTMAVEPPGGWQSGAAARPVVARGQLSDGPADPIDALIRQVCQGRASDVEVRHTGTKKLQVCFEARTADDAKKLVSDISKRPELTPYQIDFCVLVK